VAVDDEFQGIPACARIVELGLHGTPSGAGRVSATE
jgi:hypothetical protein